MDGGRIGFLGGGGGVKVGGKGVNKRIVLFCR